jgi:hypothetical protein
MSTQPIPILSPNAEMQKWYVLVYQAAIALCGSAALALKNGLATVTTLGKDILLTSTEFLNYSQYFVTPEQLVRYVICNEPIILTDAGKAASRSTQLAALTSSRDSNPDPAAKAKIQTFIDQLQAGWDAADAVAAEAAKPNPPAPTPTPAASDAWRDAEPGTIITMAGISYEVIGSAFGNMIRKLKTPPVVVPVATVAEERAAMAGYIREQLAVDEDEKVQAALMAQLTWLSKRS